MILSNMSMEGSLFYVKKGLPTIDGDFAILYSKNPYYISKDKLENAYYVPKKMCGISIEDDSGGGFSSGFHCFRCFCFQNRKVGLESFGRICVDCFGCFFCF